MQKISYQIPWFKWRIVPDNQARIVRAIQNVLTVSLRCGEDGRRLYRKIKEYLLICWIINLWLYAAEAGLGILIPLLRAHHLLQKQYNIG